MLSKQRYVFIIWFVLFAALNSLAATAQAGEQFYVHAKSAMLIDMTDGKILYEQDADRLIPPASITKVITLYLIFEAIQSGRAHLTDQVPISANAASVSGSRMHVRAGQIVALEELITGMAVVSGNDACVAAAEYLAGSTDEFVRRMNRKARELGMDRTRFMNPNGLPANGQVTTARDIARLSIAYLRRFPDSLTIHSMTSYTFNRITHHNANRLLGTCPGVDGLKTGFVCAAGYNIAVTAKRGNVRLLAVLLGAPSAGVRALEARRLVEYGYRSVAPEHADIRLVEAPSPVRSRKARLAKVSVPSGRNKKGKSSRIAESPAMAGLMRGSPNEAEDRSCPVVRPARGKSSAAVASAASSKKSASATAQSSTKGQSSKQSASSKTVAGASSPKQSTTASKAVASSGGRKATTSKPSTAAQASTSPGSKAGSPKEDSRKAVATQPQPGTKSAAGDKQKQAPQANSSAKKNGSTPPKPTTHTPDSKAKRS